jgi:hypothetical protein
MPLGRGDTKDSQRASLKVPPNSSLRPKTPSLRYIVFQDLKILFLFLLGINKLLRQHSCKQIILSLHFPGLIPSLYSNICTMIPTHLFKTLHPSSILTFGTHSFNLTRVIYSTGRIHFTRRPVPRTAPFIFNLFAEGFHWILQSYLNWELLAYYLNDFIRAIPHDVATPDYLAQQVQDYKALTDLLGIPRNDKKDELGQKVTVLGYLIDTTRMEARLPLDKLERARQAAAKAITAGSISLVDIQFLAEFLSFCSPVVRLGWVFMRRIWTFIASYPTASKFAKRRIPSGVMDDFRWWKQLLPNFNGVLLFDTDTRESISFYTVDASNIGLGGSSTLTHTTYGGRMLFPGSRSFHPSFRIPICSSHYVNI